MFETMSSIGNTEYLKKKIPQNPRYQHVKTRLDTGCSLSKYMEKVEDIKKNYRYSEDEIFKRLKVTTFAQLVLQVASISELSQSGSVNGEESPGPEDCLSVLSKAELEPLFDLHSNGSLQATPTALWTHLDHNNEAGVTHSPPRSTLQSVISGVGELDLDRNGRIMVNLSSPRLAVPYRDCPYLLLDTRDREQYDQCHIISAYSYPIAMLSRVNPYTKEVREYKNTAGKIIILYDEDERIASQAATVMCKRGFNNLFMLSGGLKLIAQKFPEGMVTGAILASCLHSPMALMGRKRCVPQPPAPQTAENKARFTSEDLSKIQQQLEETLIPSGPNSHKSSRMSTSSGQSKASSARRQLSSSGKESARDKSSRAWK